MAKTYKFSEDEQKAIRKQIRKRMKAVHMDGKFESSSKHVMWKYNGGESSPSLVITAVAGDKPKWYANCAFTSDTNRFEFFNDLGESSSLDKALLSLKGRMAMMSTMCSRF